MIKLKSKVSLKGEITVPGDKSISHRGIMLGSIAYGTTRISNFLEGADCLATIDCFRKMGIEIEKEVNQIVVHGKGLQGLSAPRGILEVGNSGTTARLMAGILAGQSFGSRISGDESLNSRPMNRIIKPLEMMSANILSVLGNNCAPLEIRPEELKGIHYHSPVASAQVKSCVLLAGLYADGETSVTEPFLSRNHTELMLREFGANIKTDWSNEGAHTHAPTYAPTYSSTFDLGARENNGKSKPTAILVPGKTLHGQEVNVPGDISSAAYFIVAGLIVPNSEILIKNVGVNPTRSGIIEVCRRMGGNIVLENERLECGEPVADIYVKTSRLKGITIEGEIIPTLIDEIPIIAVMATFAEGQTIIKDAAELKVKETDRIQTVSDNLKNMGGDITPTEDGMVVNGGKQLHGATIHTMLDHRIAMAFSVAALVASGETEILDSQCVDVSYPTFYDTLREIT